MGRFASSRPAGIQRTGYSGASAGQRGASGWVRLCGHGGQRVPGIPASSPTGPTQHPSPVQTSSVVTSACLWTLWGSSGCCKPLCTKVAHLVSKKDYSWAIMGSSPSLPSAQAKATWQEKRLSCPASCIQTRTSPLEIRVPASLNPGKTWQLGLLVCGRKWAVPMQAGPREKKVSKLHLGTAGESPGKRGIAQIRAAAVWGTVRTAVAGIFSAASP